MSLVGTGLQLVETTSGVVNVRSNLGFIVSGSSLDADIVFQDDSTLTVAGASFNNGQIFPAQVKSVNAKNNSTHVLVLSINRGAL